MNTKTTALLMALTMVLAPTAVVAAVDGSDAVDAKARDVYVEVGSTAEFGIKITEPDNAFYDNDVSWSIAYNISGKGPVSTGVSIDSEKPTSIDSKATIYMSGSEGIYTAHIKGVEDADMTDITLTYKVSTTVKNTSGLGTEEQATGAVEQTITYPMNIYVLSTPLKGSDSFSSSIYMTYGTTIEKEAPFTTGGSPDSDYVYYAIGLPDGVQMTPDGYISGTPVYNVKPSNTFEENGIEYFAYNVTVVATHKASNQSFVMTYANAIKVSDPSEFTFDVKGAVKIIKDKEEYIVLQNDTVNLTVINASSDLKAYIYDADADGGRVGLTPSDDSDNEFTIPTEGSGEFTVVMVDGADVKSFSLTVVAISQDVETGIGFAPGYTIDASA